MKRTRRWAWENTWFIYSIVGMVAVNWAVSLGTVTDIFSVFARSGWQILAVVFSFGFLWGIANLLFGIGIHRIGMSLTFPICIGLSTALGSLIPMARQPDVFGTPRGVSIVLGVVVILLGVTIYAIAGLRKDDQARRALSFLEGFDDKAYGGTLIGGLIIVILAGFFDPMLNFAFTFGDRIKEEAKAMGAAGGAEANAIWTVALMGSFVVNAVYCSILLTRNNTWSRYRLKGARGHWILAALMGIIWMASITLYGLGASRMGELGSSVGWAVFYSCIIIFSSLWGVLTGEWQDGKGQPIQTMFVGLAVLLMAIIVLGYGNSLPAG